MPLESLQKVEKLKQSSGGVYSAEHSLWGPRAQLRWTLAKALRQGGDDTGTRVNPQICHSLSDRGHLTSMWCLVSEYWVPRTETRVWRLRVPFSVHVYPDW